MSGSGAEGCFKLLVVDDEPVNRQVLINQLSLHRYEIIPASSGEEALAALERAEPDLVLTSNPLTASVFLLQARTPAECPTRPARIFVASSARREFWRITAQLEDPRPVLDLPRQDTYIRGLGSSRQPARFGYRNDDEPLSHASTT